MSTAYSPYKVFRFPEKISSLPKENAQVLPPIHVRIKPINACNHDCYYCAYRVSNLQLGENMSLKSIIPKEKMNEIIDDLSSMGVKSVTFSGGGEPLLYPHFVETIEKLIERKIQFGINTNGVFLKGRKLDLIASHATWIRISVDGWDSESYARFRKTGTEQFDQLLANLKGLRRMAPQLVIGINIIVDKENSSHLYDMSKIFQSIGVNNIKYSPCVMSNDMTESHQYHLAFIDKVLEQINLFKGEQTDSSIEIFNSYSKNAPDISTKPYTWCPSLQITPVIGADLLVYSCQDKAYTKEGEIGSIEKVSFKNFWETNKDKFFKINPSKHCPHHCVADKKNRMLSEHLNEDPLHQLFV